MFYLWRGGPLPQLALERDQFGRNLRQAVVGLEDGRAVGGERVVADCLRDQLHHQALGELLVLAVQVGLALGELIHGAAPAPDAGSR